jgi:hypothetical protein
MGTVTDMADFRRKREAAAAGPAPEASNTKKQNEAVVLGRKEALAALDDRLAEIGKQMAQLANHDFPAANYERVLSAEEASIAEYRRLIPTMSNPHSRLEANMRVALSKDEHAQCNRVLHNLSELLRRLNEVLGYGLKIRSIREELNRLRNTFQARRLSIVDRQSADECMHTAVDYAARPAFYIEHGDTMLAEAKTAVQESRWSDAQRFLHEAEQVPAYLKHVESAIKGGWLAEV